MEKNTIVDNEHLENEKKTAFKENNCAVTNVFKVIGGKWKVLLINAIYNDCPKRFGELRREMEDVTQATLTAQLRELERDGIICRKAYAESPPRVEYKLTDLGKTLMPVIRSLEDWWLAYAQYRNNSKN
ncbi:helix-turn-helix domain-containing protein [Olivibacter sp. CPCC 100613]|uniref:winged helix-turn-helix transcriptional regulator n=1 Tax=Olivibacter sp. CPCC 100613 TaxID=3079931 RepID=UPI002FF74E41